MGERKETAGKAEIKALNTDTNHCIEAGVVFEKNLRMIAAEISALAVIALVEVLAASQRHKGIPTPTPNPWHVTEYPPTCKKTSYTKKEVQGL